MELLFYHKNGIVTPVTNEKMLAIGEEYDCSRGIFSDVEGIPVVLDQTDGIWEAEMTTENMDNWYRKFVDVEKVTDENAPEGFTAETWLEYASGKSFRELWEEDTEIIDIIETGKVIEITEGE